MREERAIQILEQRQCCRECVVENCTCTECDEAFEMSIKAIKQESILDKIRAEIKKEIIPRDSDQYDHEIKWQNCGLRMALKIIDKYKAESEAENG